MKNLIIVVASLLALAIQSYAQSTAISSVSVKSIQWYSKSETNGKAGVEIELYTSDSRGFYVGALFWCLQVGELPPRGGHGLMRYTNDGKPLMKITDIKSHFFGFTKEEWKKLKNGDAMRLTWGCPREPDYKKAQPFAFLNKKLLKK